MTATSPDFSVMNFQYFVLLYHLCSPTHEMEGVNHRHRGDFDLVVGAVLARPGGQRVVVADGAGQVVHQIQLPLHRTLDDQGDRVKLGAPLDKLRYSRGEKKEGQRRCGRTDGDEGDKRRRHE